MLRGMLPTQANEIRHLFGMMRPRCETFHDTADSADSLHLCAANPDRNETADIRGSHIVSIGEGSLMSFD